MGTASAADITVNNSAGPVADFTSIQAAVDAAKDGDTIIVYSGVYTENVDVNKELAIISQSGNPEDTVVRSPLYWEYNSFNVTANNVTIYGFKVEGGNPGICLDGVQYNNISNNQISGDINGIVLNSSNNTLYNNICSGGFSCLSLSGSDNNLFINNSFSAMELGISMRHSNNNILTGNSIGGDDHGLIISCSSNNTLENNSIWGCEGVRLFSSNNNTVSSNYVRSDEGSIRISSSYNNVIYNNYIFDSHAFSNAGDDGNNIWNITKTPGTNIIGGPFLGGNYWSDYEGIDTNWDGLGDTLLPYNSSGHIASGGDHLPLVTPAGPAPAKKIQATVDINPGVLNPKSKGKWVTVYIELPACYDVNDIDVSTILLMGSLPAECAPVNVGDCDCNDIPDLMVKFDKQNLLPLLDAENMELTVTGKMMDGSMFEGTDTIRVLIKVK